MELEIDCDRCNGTGQMTFKNTAINCQRCQQGKVPSPEGQKILDFLGKWVLNDVINDVDDVKWRVRRVEDNRSG